MKAILLALSVSLPTVVTLAGPSGEANRLARAGGLPESKIVQLAANGNDQQPTVGDEQNQNPGQGKAKGHYKSDPQSTDESTPADASKAATATPSTGASTPSAAPAGSTAPAPVKVKDATSSIPALSAKELKAELDKRIRQVNTLDNNATAAKAGREAVAKETGVPISKLQAQLKDYKVETAGLLLANELAKATGKPAATFLKERMEQNRDWDHICAEHKFDPSTVFAQFDRVTAAMEAAQKTQKK